MAGSSPRSICSFTGSGIATPSRSYPLCWGAGAFSPLPERLPFGALGGVVLIPRPLRFPSVLLDGAVLPTPFLLFSTGTPGHEVFPPPPLTPPARSLRCHVLAAAAPIASLGGGVLAPSPMFHRRGFCGHRVPGDITASPLVPLGGSIRTIPPLCLLFGIIGGGVPFQHGVGVAVGGKPLEETVTNYSSRQARGRDREDISQMGGATVAAAGLRRPGYRGGGAEVAARGHCHPGPRQGGSHVSGWTTPPPGQALRQLREPCWCLNLENNGGGES